VENYKQVLEEGDIGAIRVPSNVRGSTDFLFVPVMVTHTKMSQRNGTVRYAICTQHGHLEGMYSHKMIEYDAHMTQTTVKIDPNKPGFKNNLSVASASALYNTLGGKTFCHCKSDCSKSKTYKCVLLGKLCRPKCHAPRKDGLPVHCSNCCYGTGTIEAKLYDNSNT
jgi:hypothetical protein